MQYLSPKIKTAIYVKKLFSDFNDLGLSIKNTILSKPINFFIPPLFLFDAVGRFYFFIAD